MSQSQKKKTNSSSAKKIIAKNNRLPEFQKLRRLMTKSSQMVLRILNLIMINQIAVIIINVYHFYIHLFSFMLYLDIYSMYNHKNNIMSINYCFRRD